MLENRSYDFMVGAGNDERGNIITGRPIVYDQKTNIGGLFDEVIDRGALDSADLKDVRFLVNHDLSRIPLARSRNNNANSTMQLTVDSEGMGIRVLLDTENNADARALYSAVERQDISGMSFMFAVDGEEWENLDSDMPLRHITKISNVVEVSAVTFPAYPQTEIDARSAEELESAKATLENVKKRNAIALENAELELLKEKIKLY